jgi:hypothetical protein
MQLHRFKQTTSLQQRLSLEAQRVLRARARAIPLLQRLRAIRKARWRTQLDGIFSLMIARPAPAPGSGFFVDEVFNIDQRIEHCVATIAPSPHSPLAFIGDENARLRSRPI